MEWRGDAAGFVAATREAHDLSAFRDALATVPNEAWGDARVALEAALSDDAGESTTAQRRLGAQLVDRMRTPAALLRRQLRLEKLRLLQEADAARSLLG